MKDYRTWWQKGFDVDDELEEVEYDFWYDSKHEFFRCEIDGWISPDNRSCYLEALWATREGLS